MVIYLLVGIMWITASDYLLSVAINDPQVMSFFQSIKGWLYVILTGVLFYLLLSRENTIIVNYYNDAKRKEKMLYETKNQLQAMLELSPLGVIVCDANGMVTIFNEQAEEILGLSKEDFVSKTLSGVPARIFRKARSSSHTSNFHDENAFQQSIEIVDGKGENRSLQLAYSDIYNEDGIRIAVQVMFNDITNENVFRRKVNYLESFDATTGLYNFDTFFDESKALVKGNHEAQHALIILDVDRLHMINHKYGNDFGDELIRLIALKLKNQISDRGVVARLRGDEFGIFLPNVSDQYDVNSVVQSLMNELQKSNQTLDVSINITASAGASLYPLDSESFEELYQKASVALKNAKEERNRFCFFDESLNYNLDSYFYEHELHRAILNEEIILHYQPQYDMKTKKMVGIEALARWEHPEQGQISPATFIPVAEETGLIVPMTDHIIRQVCQDYNTLIHAGINIPRVAVNISTKQFSKVGFVNELLTTLENYQMPPEAFEIEITETVTMDIERNLEKLNVLRDAGIKVSIDDFGTGYSSLMYIRELPIDYIKIDRSFIHALGDDGEKMVQFMIDLAKLCEVGVISEGVENSWQQDFLLRSGCRIAQGYYYDKPMALQDLLLVKASSI